MSIKPSLIGILLCVGCVAAAPTDLRAAQMRDGSHDFDFSFGTWKEHSRRLLHPLSGSSEWIEWDGVTVVKKIWDGRANVAEFKGETPNGLLELIALRVYNPTTQQWSLNFATSNVGRLGDVPGIGEFKDGRIDFYDQERLGERMILVRFSVWKISDTEQQSEQAFSDDGGKTWEVNWTNHYVRTSEATDDAAAG
jgi:hypothetical protein